MSITSLTMLMFSGPTMCLANCNISDKIVSCVTENDAGNDIH